MRKVDNGKNEKKRRENNAFFIGHPTGTLNGVKSSLRMLLFLAVFAFG